MNTAAIGTYVKYPIVKEPVNLRITTGFVYESFKDLTIEKALSESAPKEFDLIDIFTRQHEENTTGLTTSKVNNYEFFTLRNLAEMYKASIRYTLIELKGLKRSRSQDQNSSDESEEERTINSNKMRLKFKFNWLLSTNFSKKRFNWMWHYHPKTMVDAVRAFARGEKNIPSGWFEELKPRLQMSINDFGQDRNPGLISRLLKMGIIEVKAFDHVRKAVDPDFPPCYQITLKNFKGEYMALVDNKRESQYGFAGILYPVFSIFEKKFVDPLVWLQRVADIEWKDISSYRGSEDLEITDPRLNWRWPSKLEQTKGYRSTMLQEFLTEFVCRYGDVVPATIVDGHPQLSAMSLVTALNTVTIDYMQEKFEEPILDETGALVGINDKSIEMKLKIALKADSVCPICLAGGKGSDLRVRKYLLSYDNGVALLSTSPDNDQKRTGAIRSQLVRSSKLCKMTVAVVDMADTKTGVLITPSGIQKQEENIFLPRISYEPIPEEEIDNGKWTEKEIPSWDGNPRVVWITESKKALKIGKLVDNLANKFMPRAYPQAETEDGTLIDIIIPYTELNKKGNTKSFLSKAHEEWAWLPTEKGLEKVKVLITERKLFRSGNASENTPAEWRTFQYAGIDGMKIAQTHSEIGQVVYPEVDYTFAEECIALAKKLDPERPNN